MQSADQQTEASPDEPDAVKIPAETLSAENIENEDNLVIFHDGQSLSSDIATLITSETPTQVVVLAGASASGKTTLLAGIYEKFSNRSMKKFLFAGSQTLPGFEERCHLARIVSGRGISDTERTKARDEMELLHLKVSRSDTPEDHIEILVTDLSGEAFRMIKDSTEQCKKMKLLSRADHFALLIDGKQLSNKKSRQTAFTDCRSLLRSCVDAQMLGKQTDVEIVFSKWDLVEPQKRSNENSEFIKSIKGKISDEFREVFRSLGFYEIASRPERTETYSFGFQLEELFAEWANDNIQENHLFHEQLSPRDTKGIEGYSAN